MAGSYSVQFQTGCGNNCNYINAKCLRDVAVTNGVTSGGINGSLPVGVTILAGDERGERPAAARRLRLDRGHHQLIRIRLHADWSGRQPTGRPAACRAYQAIFTAGCGSRGSYAPQAYNDTNVLEPADHPRACRPPGHHRHQRGDAAGAGHYRHRHQHLRERPEWHLRPRGHARRAPFGVSQTRHGRDSLPDLDPGLYQVIFEPGCGNNADLALQAFRSDETEADPVSAVSGTVSGINAVMQPAGAISCHVRTASGRPVELSCITLTGVSGRARSQAACCFGSSYKPRAAGRWPATR